MHLRNKDFDSRKKAYLMKPLNKKIDLPSAMDSAIVVKYQNKILYIKLIPVEIVSCLFLRYIIPIGMHIWMGKKFQFIKQITLCEV